MFKLGRNEPLHVIDVDSQSLTKEPWTVEKWSNLSRILKKKLFLYFIFRRTQYFGLPPEKRKRTLNVISLEFSHTPMAQYIRYVSLDLIKFILISAPYFVQRIDWVHALWPPEETAKWEALNTPPTASAPPGIASARLSIIIFIILCSLISFLMIFGADFLCV